MSGTPQPAAQGMGRAQLRPGSLATWPLAGVARGLPWRPVATGLHIGGYFFAAGDMGLLQKPRGMISTNSRRTALLVWLRG